MNTRNFESQILQNKVAEIKGLYPSLSSIFVAIYKGDLKETVKRFKHHPKMEAQTFFRGVENVFSLEAIKKGSITPEEIIEAVAEGKIYISEGYKNMTPDFLQMGQDKYLSNSEAIRSNSVSLHEEVLFAIAQYLLFEENRGDFTVTEVFTNMYKIDNKFTSYFMSSWVRVDLKTKCFNYYLKTGEVIDYSQAE